MKKIPAAIFLLAMLTAATAAAAPLDVIRDKYDGIKALVSKNLDRKSFDDAVRKELDTFVDYQELSKRTLGDNWNKLKPKEQQRFVAGFRQMIQRSYIKKFDPSAQFTLEIDPTVDKAADGSVIVKSKVRAGKSEAVVNYSFHQVKGKWMAFDVIIDDVSMMKNYRRQFNKIWEAEGFDGLMAKIDKKNTEKASP